MQSYMDSRLRQLEYQQQQQQCYYEQQKHMTPGQTCVTREREGECKCDVVRDNKQEENKVEEEWEEESSTDNTTESSAVAKLPETKEKEKEEFLSPERNNANQVNVVEVATKGNGERINLPDENGGVQPKFEIVHRIDAKAPQSIFQNKIMQRFQDQLAPPQFKTAAETIPALPTNYAKLAKPLPLASPTHSPAPQRHATAPTAESVNTLSPGFVELTRPLPLISPIHSPVPQRQTLVVETAPALPPVYLQKMKPLPLISPLRSPPATALVGSVLEPSQSETERIASEMRRLEMLGYSPSLPAIRDRDRQNRASMGTVVKKFDPRRMHKYSQQTRK